MSKNQTRSDWPRDTDREKQDIFEIKVCNGAQEHRAEQNTRATESTRSPTRTTTDIIFSLGVPTDYTLLTTHLQCQLSF